MVAFLANRTNLQQRRLHDRIKNRLSGEFDAVRRRRTEPREPGPYRVVGTIDPIRMLPEMDDPADEARVEIGFQLGTTAPFEYYWFNWIEPERQLLVGWHQDDTHPELGPVHLQVTDDNTPVTHRSARFIDTHPLDVVAQRRHQLPDVVAAVELANGRPVGIGRL